MGPIRVPKTLENRSLYYCSLLFQTVYFLHLLKSF